jgi:hypothetical protein
VWLGLALANLLSGAHAQADVQNLVFASTGGITINLPRGWRVSEQPSYPGVVLWLRRSVPNGTILVSNELTSKELVCSWPPECRDGTRSIAANYACAVTVGLKTRKTKMGAIENGPRDNIQAGFSSVWLEYNNQQRFVRQAFVMNGQRAITITLASTSAAGRAAHAREFDQMLRSVKSAAPKSVENLVGSEPSQGSPVADAAPVESPATTAAPLTNASDLYQEPCQADR